MPGHRHSQLEALNDIYRKLATINNLSSGGSTAGAATLAEQQNQTALLTSMVASLLNDKDLEFLMVRDTGNSDLVVRQLISYNENDGTFTMTYESIDGTVYTPVGPLEYLDSSAALGQIILKLQELIDEKDVEIIESLGIDSAALQVVTIGNPTADSRGLGGGTPPAFQAVVGNTEVTYTESNRNYSIFVPITSGISNTGIVNLYFEWSTTNLADGAGFVLRPNIAGLPPLDVVQATRFTNVVGNSQIIQLSFDNTTTNYTDLVLAIAPDITNTTYPVDYTLRSLGGTILGFNNTNLITRVDTYQDLLLTNTVYKDAVDNPYTLLGIYIRDSNKSTETKVSVILNDILNELKALVGRNDVSIIESLGYDDGVLKPITLETPAVGNIIPPGGQAPDITVITPNLSFSYLEYNRNHQIRVPITGGFASTGVVNLYFDFSTINPNGALAGARFYLDNPSNTQTLDTILIPAFTNAGNESQIVRLTFDNTTTNFTTLNLRIQSDLNTNYPANYSLTALGTGVDNFTSEDLITRIDTYQDLVLIDTIYKDSADQLYNLVGTYVRDSNIATENKLNETLFNLNNTVSNSSNQVIQISQNNNKPYIYINLSDGNIPTTYPYSVNTLSYDRGSYSESFVSTGFPTNINSLEDLITFWNTNIQGIKLVYKDLNSVYILGVTVDSLRPYSKDVLRVSNSNASVTAEWNALTNSQVFKVNTSLITSNLDVLVNSIQNQKKVESFLVEATVTGSDISLGVSKISYMFWGSGGSIDGVTVPDGFTIEFTSEKGEYIGRSIPYVIPNVPDVNGFQRITISYTF